MRRFKFGADKEDVAASESGGKSRSLERDDGPIVLPTVAVNGVYGVVGGAAGICGEVIFGDEMIVGGDGDGNE